MKKQKYTPVVIVTGASAGLGRAIAHAFAKRGAALGLIARNPEALAAAKAECEALGARTAVMAVDVANAEKVDEAAGRLEKELGPIDVWVNNAMVTVLSPVREMEAEDFRRVTEVLYLGFVHGTMAALKRMLPRNQGSIVQIGSALSYRSIPLQAAYCAAKHAINGFTDSLRCELIHDDSAVRLTTVQMPAMNTTQFGWMKNRMPKQPQPVPPIFQPEVAARAVVKAGLARNPCREYWVGSSTILSILGQRIAPGLLDRYLGKTGYDSQQIADQPTDPAAPDNLHQYVPGTHSARGKFDDKAKGSSFEVQLSLHPYAGLLVASGLIAAGVAASLAVKRSLGA